MLTSAPDVEDPVVQLHKENLDQARYDSRRIGWRQSLLEDVRRTQAPVQIIWGANDRLAHPSVTSRLAQCRAGRPDLGLDVIAECGHWAQFESPDQVNDWLLRFHGEASRPSRAACIGIAAAGARQSQ